MRIFKNKSFQNWTKKLKLSDAALIKTVQEIIKGAYEASLGGNIYKKRIAIENQGKRGGTRTIVAFKAHEKTFFIYGFSKNKKENITLKEKYALKALAKLYFSYTENEIEQAIKIGEFFEVKL